MLPVLDAAEEYRICGGVSARPAAAPSTTRPLATSTWLRESTRSSAASAHPAVAASTSVRNWSARSAPTRESSGTLCS
jgi:hypothetical protein